MANNKKTKNSKKLIISLVAIFAIMTLATCGVAVYMDGGLSQKIFNKSTDKISKSVSVNLSESEDEPVKSQAENDISQEGNQDKEVIEKIKIPMPSELKAATLKAGREILLEGDNEKTKISIDEAIDFADQLGLNAIVIDTVDFNNKLIYNSIISESYNFSDGFSPIDYAVSKARDKGLYTIVTYYATSNNFGENPIPLDQFNADVFDKIAIEADNFAKSVECDAVLVDGYYYPKSETSYLQYINAGAATDFNRFEKDIPKEILRCVKNAFNKYKTASLVGILTEPQWASSVENQDGSETTALFSCLTDGNADIISLHDDISFDFISIKTPGSTEDETIPFGKISSWWADKCSQKNIPFFFVHAAHKAATDEVGWSEYDQLSRQVIKARTYSGFGGSIFDSLHRMKENQKEFATKLMGYYEGTVKEEHIMTNLEIISPSKTTFTSFDPIVAFSGNTDPNTDATINGVKIETDENGYFSLKMDLKEGANTFKVVHKGKTKVYKITRVIEVVRNVAPTGILNVDGSTRLTITAEAYKEAQVYAVVAGQTIPMQVDTQTADERLRNTAYVKFKGIFTIPDATTTVQNLGDIVVYGKWNNIKKSKKGATIKINARALPSDGKPVVVTAEMAETFPADTASAYSSPNYFPIPKGSLDYAVGSEIKYSVNDRGRIKTYSFFKLASGLRVLSDDIATVSTKNAPVGNKITGVTVTADRRHTKVILATKQQVSFKAKYQSDKITFQFHYTDLTPQGMSLDQNPLFSNLSFKGNLMTLNIKEKGIFFGYTAYYDDFGNLVLRFNNPPLVSGTDLTGSKIVIDPGHGGVDTGALGYLASHPEKVLNWSIATKLEKILTSRGATVIKLPTQNHNYSLQERVKMTSEYDPHLFISVHSNSSPYNTSTVGTEAFYFNPFSYAYSQYVSQNVAAAMNTSNRGGKFGYYYVTRSMQYPAILVECGFMSNPAEYNKLINAQYQSNVAQAIANAIGSYFSLMGKNVEMLTGTQVSGNMNVGDCVDVTTSSDCSLSTDSSSLNGAISLSETHIELEVDVSTTIWAEIENSENDEIVWKIENPEIALLSGEDASDSVSVIGINKGTTNVKAYLKDNPNFVAICKIEVN